MNIKLGPASKKTPVFEAQARYMAKAIRSLIDACSRQFRQNTDLSLDDFYIFQGLPEYHQFLEAAMICGFTCTDFSADLALDEIHHRPNEAISSLSFSGLRHYIHTLHRAETWNSQYSESLWTAIQTGALLIVAKRLENDQSIYE